MWTPARDLLMNKIQRAFEKKNIIWRQHALESIYSRYGTFSRKWHNKKREEMICFVFQKREKNLRFFDVTYSPPIPV
jgi:hypothetical protein